MKPEITLDELPAPGEPLKPKIHDSNQALLDNDLQYRLSLINAILTRRQRAKLNKRYSQLAHKLRRAKYNDLIVKRWETYQLYLRLKTEIAALPRGSRAGRRDEWLTVIATGQNIAKQIAALQPLVTEFEDIKNRLDAHDRAVKWQIEDKQNREAFKREATVWESQLKAVMRQSARLHYAGTDGKGKTFIKIPVIERTIFKDDRVLYQIKTTGQSPIEKIFGKWHSALPYNVDISDLTSDETLANLSAACNRVVTVERSRIGTNLFYSISRLDSPDGIPQKVLYSKVIEWYPTQDHVKTPWAAGVTNDRRAQFFNFEEYPHVLIAGSTKSGKSNHVNQMITTLVTLNSPSELRLVLVDMKGGIEFTHWSGLAHQLRPMAKTPEDVLTALREVRSIMEKRLGMFEQAKAKDLATFNKKSKEPLPRIITFVDEMATLLGLDSLTTDIHHELRVLTAQGRAVGVHMVLCTQYPSIEVVPQTIKSNMVMRISGKMPSLGASMVILDTNSAMILPNVVGRMVFSAGRLEIICQSPYISDEEIAHAVSISKQFTTVSNDEFAGHLNQPKASFTRDDFIQICLDKLGGKLSYKRVYDLVPKDLITERGLKYFVDDILESESIEHRGVQYQLKKNRNSWVMVPMSQIASQEKEHDTEEIKLQSYDIEELEEAANV